jgi:hypothetical protein
MFRRYTELLYLSLPAFLWPPVFVVLREVFITAMLLATLLLGALTLLFNKEKVYRNLRLTWKSILAGLILSFLLYVIFVFGKIFLTALNLQHAVSNVYASIYSSSDAMLLPLLLTIIGAMEELYWRGGQLAVLEERLTGSRAFMFSIAYYTLVHIWTLNISLLLGALTIGIYMVFTAKNWA